MSCFAIDDSTPYASCARSFSSGYATDSSRSSASESVGTTLFVPVTMTTLPAANGYAPIRLPEVGGDDEFARPRDRVDTAEEVVGCLRLSTRGLSLGVVVDAPDLVGKALPLVVALAEEVVEPDLFEGSSSDRS